MKTLSEPLTIEEIKRNAKDTLNVENYIEGVVPVALEEMIGRDEEDLQDYVLSPKLIGDGSLQQMDYEIVGFVDGKTLLLKVSGNASTILEEYDLLEE